jgi:DNA repair protein RecN (Recombination protein N)
LREQRLARERDRETVERERVLLGDEIRDLEALGFDAAGWEQELAEHRRLAHAGELIVAARAALSAIDEADTNAGSLLAQAVSGLDEAARLDPSIDQARNDLATAAAHASEAAHQLRRYLQGIDEDPGRLDQLDRRLRAVHDTARRYRVEAARLGEALEQRQARFAALGGGESDEALARQEAAAEAAFRSEAVALTRQRRAAAQRLSSEVTARLQELAMEGGQFSAHLEPLAEPAAAGLESVEFRVAAHAGQAVGPLARVASGGELSRIALAIQVLLGGGTGVPTLIFDEVDTGIGGRVAEIVGKLLADLSAHHQVLCVTHLPQVAARAAHQVRVSKKTAGGVTLARVEPLDAASRVEEIARMLGGTRITETTRQHAAELLAAPPAAPQASKIRLRNRA